MRLSFILKAVGLQEQIKCLIISVCCPKKTYYHISLTYAIPSLKSIKGVLWCELPEKYIVWKIIAGHVPASFLLSLPQLLPYTT